MTGVRHSAGAGILGAAVTIVSGLLHPKGSGDVGSVDEWMIRVGNSEVWTPAHLGLLTGSVLYLLASVGIARAFPEAAARSWTRLALVASCVTTSIAAVTFLIDGPVAKNVADLWLASPDDPALSGAALLATEVGFALVAGLQLTTGMGALLFAGAGFSTRAHPRRLAWLALAAGVTALIPGAAHYLTGPATWSVNMVYVSSALLSAWFLSFGLRLWHGGNSAHNSSFRAATSRRPLADPA